MKVLVTGGTGFVGTVLCERLRQQGVELVLARRCAEPAGSGHTEVDVGDIGESTDWRGVLEGVDTVIHLAARVHVMKETSSDPDEAFARVNLHGTRQLARQAAECGVSRLVFASTIKVNGEMTRGRAFTADDPVMPSDPYARSKQQAEAVLEQISSNSALRTTVVRSPLVYGPGVGGNFLRLMRLVKAGVPLPFGAVENRRSLVGVENLCNFLITCARSSVPDHDVFLVADAESVSTRDLILKIARCMHKRPWILPVPPGLLETAARLAGKMAEFDRLCGSLEVDIEKTRKNLDWEPPFSLDQQLEQTVAGFLES